MESPAKLQAELDRAQSQMESGAGHIARQKALIAERLDHGEPVVRSLELLATLEETQRLLVERRDLLRRALVGALLVGKEPELDRVNRNLRCESWRNDHLRRKNARLRDRIAEVVNKHQELRGVVDRVALKQGLYAEIGVPFLEQVQDNLRERALAAIAVKSELLDCFNGLLR